MNREIRRKLIELYANYRVEEVDNKQNLIAQQLGKEGLGEFTFHEIEEMRRFNEPIREAKKSIERNLYDLQEENLPEEEEVKSYLRYINRLKNQRRRSQFNEKLNLKIENTYFLLKAAHYEDWSKQIQKHFEKVYQILITENWNIYFLSYNPDFIPTPYSKFRKVIKHALDDDNINLNEADIRRQNAFALLIQDYLKSHGLVGYAEEQRELSQDLGKNAERALSFLQVIDKDMLEISDSYENIHYRIYEIFSNRHGSAIPSLHHKSLDEKVRLLTVNPIDSLDQHLAYEKWYSDMRHLGSDEESLNASPEKFMEMLEEVKNVVENARDKLIDHILPINEPDSTETEDQDPPQEEDNQEPQLTQKEIFLKNLEEKIYETENRLIEWEDYELLKDNPNERAEARENINRLKQRLTRLRDRREELLSD